MPANFLIVCGGAGRGILSRFYELGFNGALQIDVQSELVQLRDSRVQTFGLPVSPAVEPTPNSVASLGAYEVRLDNEWKKHHTQNHHKGDYKECGEGDCQNYQRQVKHVATAIQGVGPTAISNGMSQNPIIGRSYITRTIVSQKLANTIQLMHDLNPANQQDVVVWLVASTCGGTGNGIVHHVADLVRQVFGQYHLTVKFVRIGDATYVSMYPLTRVSTFWSVLTDYGYRKQFHDAQLPNTTLDFYYLDVPDVGGNVKVREALVQSAFVALIDPTMDAQLRVRLYDGGGVVMARVGEWGNKFDRDLVCDEGTQQLINKLNKLNFPSEPEVLSETEKLETTEVPIPKRPPVEQIPERSSDKPSVVVVVKDTPLPHLKYIKQKEFATTREVEQFKSHQAWHMMQRAVIQQCTDVERRIRTQQIQLHLVLSDNSKEPLIFDQSNNHRYGSQAYIRHVQMAQRAKARIKCHLLGNDEHQGFVMTELLEAWNALIATAPFLIMHFLISKVERRRIYDLGIDRFLRAYFHVARCLELYDDAERIIMQSRQQSDTLMKILIQRKQKSYGHGFVEEQILPYGKSYFIYFIWADLDTMIGTKTWLEIIEQHTNESSEFCRAVELGAIGLTEEGLKSVLEVHPHANVPQIVDEVNTNCGRNDASWWQGMQRPNMWGEPAGEPYWFDYRIFPRLPEELLDGLKNANAQWEQTEQQPSPRYMYISSPALGLNVHAVQCSVPGLNEVEQIKQLILPLYNYIHPQSVMYETGTFDSKKYRQIQCTRSIGLPVRIPAQLRNDPVMKQMWDELLTHVEDCFVVDDR